MEDEHGSDGGLHGGADAELDAEFVVVVGWWIAVVVEADF